MDTTVLLLHLRRITALFLSACSAVAFLVAVHINQQHVRGGVTSTHAMRTVFRHTPADVFERCRVCTELLQLGQGHIAEYCAA
jgi:Flp pilus assembly protein TadB